VEAQAIASGVEVKGATTSGSQPAHGRSPHASLGSRVLVGYGGWLFLRNPLDGTLEHGRGGSSSVVVEGWSQELRRRVAWSEENERGVSGTLRARPCARAWQPR
jgi:hypothetical protein